MMAEVQKDVKSIVKPNKKSDGGDKKAFSVSSSGSFKKLNDQVQQQAKLIEELTAKLSEAERKERLVVKLVYSRMVT